VIPNAAATFVASGGRRGSQRAARVAGTDLASDPVVMRRFPRARGFDYRGRHRYFLTMCAHQRRMLFADLDLVTRLRVQLLRTASERQFEILAYTFMPDHFHLLVEASAEECDLVQFATTFRRRATTECAVSLRPLWQDGYHDQVMRDDDRVEPIIEYLLNKPVRAGLAGPAADYPRSWSVTSDSCGGV